MSNRLAHETSPYLLQHKDNPVDWYPWGEEALARARADDKPIFLSIGYSACHWCHVMEHESFEDRETAKLLNALFVPIKVDREERPDLDSIYMDAVQRLTGHGGWPMSVFLTPDGRPFFGGTYFPPEPRHGMPAFKTLLTAVSDAYRDKRADVEQSATRIAESLGHHITVPDSLLIGSDTVVHAARALASSYDPENAGFGNAPKFPQPMSLEVLLRARRHGYKRATNMVEHTLTKMAQGGIYDHLGGGFHRYSVDDQWLVPHFEKMLYDNAQLARIYTNAYQATGHTLFRSVAEQTLRYVQREMTSPEGGFYATQDADSEGEEGKFFVWTPDEVTTVLGEDAKIFMHVYGVTEYGNFEGKNILHLYEDLASTATEMNLDLDELENRLAACRARLFAVREKRIHPARDEKIITSWNGLMLRAFVTAAAAFGDRSFLATATANAAFMLRVMVRDGRLYRTYKDDEAKLNGYLEDYACLADGLLALYETTGAIRWLEEGRGLVDTLLDRFADPEGGPFFNTSDDHERLVNRPRDVYDNAVPAGNSVAAEVLLRLSAHTGEERYRIAALHAIAPLQDAMTGAPLAFGRLLCAADMAIESPRELAIIGNLDAPDTEALVRVANARFDPNLVLALSDQATASASGSPILQGRTMSNGRATAYFCERYTCRTPVTELEALQALLA
jgi:uncharacterized protein YyaL (SSP411 family)